MTKILPWFTLVVALSACTSIPPTNSPAYDLVIHDVQLFDSRTKTVRPHQSVAILGNKIVEVVPADQSPSAKQTIEGRNRLLTPGFIDTHVHTQHTFKYTHNYIPDSLAVSLRKTYQNILAQHFLKYGVTTIIDMGQKDAWVDETIQWQQNPTPDFPNIFINGSSMISDHGRRPAPHHLKIMDAEMAEDKVNEYADKGLKYMKLYSHLRPTEMEAMVAAGKKRGILFNAHVDHNLVTIGKAMDLGVRNFEHFFTLTPSVLEYSTHWGEMEKKYELKGIAGIDDFAAAMSLFFAYIEEAPEIRHKLLQLFTRMGEEGATLSTALHVLAATAGHTEYFSSFNQFPLRSEPTLNQFTSRQKQRLYDAFTTLMRFAKIAHEKGVLLRIGTDCYQGGRAMLSEFGLFAKAGFSAAEILQIATWNGYKAMQLTDRFGTIEAGKQADLVLFDRNPLEDTAHFQSPKTVIKGGEVFVPTPSLAFTLLEQIMENGTDRGLNWFEQEKENPKYKLNAHEMKMITFHLAASVRPEAAERVIRLNKILFPDRSDLLEPDLLNGMGYYYISLEDYDKAIELFQWNIEEFPDEWNGYDSLGEAYALTGKTELAIRNYEKSIRLNPENEHGKEQLKKLREAAEGNDR